MYRTVHISYNGTTSEEVGVISCKIENRDYAEKFVSGREIQKESITMRGKYKTNTYLNRINRQPHKFKVELYCENMTDEKVREISKWFFQDKYCDFIASDSERIYYAMPVGEPKLVVTGGAGYVSFDMECRDEFSYSPKYMFEYDFSDSTLPQIITVNNLGDIPVYPYIEIDVIQDNSTIKITNLSNQGLFSQMSTFIDDIGTVSTGDDVQYPLVAGEHIEIDCMKEIIKSSEEPVTYRYDNFYGDFMELVSGQNRLQIEGKCKIRLIVQYKYLI